MDATRVTIYSIFSLFMKSTRALLSPPASGTQHPPSWFENEMRCPMKPFLYSYIPFATNIVDASVLFPMFD